MDVDHMLNGKNSRSHHQDIIQQVQRDRFARDIHAARNKGKTSLSVRAVLATLMNLVVQN